MAPSALSELELAGVVQLFERTVELAWKTIKDYLDDHAVAIAPPVVPRQVIKAAFASQVITDGQVWIDMLDHRNLLSHTYNEVVFHQAVDAIATRYLPAFTTLHAFFTAQSAT